MAAAGRTTLEDAGSTSPDPGHVSADDVVREVKGAAEDLKSAAAEHGRNLLETAKAGATTFADQRKNDAAKSVSDIASSLRGTGQSFEDRPNIKAFVDSAADGLETFADGLKQRSFADIYGDIEDYARRSPLTVGAVAVAAGFLLARFIKSSSDDLSDQAELSRSRSSGRAKAAAPVDA